MDFAMSTSGMLLRGIANSKPMLPLEPGPTTTNASIAGEIILFLNANTKRMKPRLLPTIRSFLKKRRNAVIIAMEEAKAPITNRIIMTITIILVRSGVHPSVANNRFATLMVLLTPSAVVR